MKIKIYNKKTPLSTFEALNQRGLEELLQDGKVYKKGMSNVLSETLKRYENLQNSVNFDTNPFTPTDHFKLLLPKLSSSDIVEALDSARLFTLKENEKNEVSLLDFSDYNIDLNDPNVVNKFNKEVTETNRTLGEVIDFPEDSCIDLLKDIDMGIKVLKEENREFDDEKKINLCEFNLFGEKDNRKFESKENRFSAGSTNNKYTKFGRKSDHISLKNGRKSANILSTKNENSRLKDSSSISSAFGEALKQRNNIQRKILENKKRRNNDYFRTKTPTPIGSSTQEIGSRNGKQFLSPPPIINNFSSVGISFNSVFPKNNIPSGNNTNGNVTPMKFGKSDSKTKNNKFKKSYTTLEDWRNHTQEGKKLKDDDEVRGFNSKSPIFMKLKQKNKSSKKKNGNSSKSPFCGRRSPQTRESDNLKKYFNLNEKSKKLLASKPTRSTIPSKYHQHLIKLIDGFGSKFDFSDSGKVKK